MTTPNETPTPRTDAESTWIMSISQIGGFYVPSNFARQLEDELTKANTEIRRLKTELEIAYTPESRNDHAL